MNTAFEVNGIGYPNIRVPEEGITRSAVVMDGDATARAKSLAMIRDVKGTFYNYKITLDVDSADYGQYDALYEILTAPVESHALRVPYGQTTLLFRAYITSVEDTLETMADGRNRWRNPTLSFVAMEPQRVP